MQYTYKFKLYIGKTILILNRYNIKFNFLIKVHFLIWFGKGQCWIPLSISIKENSGIFQPNRYSSNRHINICLNNIYNHNHFPYLEK